MRLLTASGVICPADAIITVHVRGKWRPEASRGDAREKTKEGKREAPRCAVGHVSAKDGASLQRGAAQRPQWATRVAAQRRGREDGRRRARGGKCARKLTAVLFGISRQNVPSLVSAALPALFPRSRRLCCIVRCVCISVLYSCSLLEKGRRRAAAIARGTCLAIIMIFSFSPRAASRGAS